MPPPGLDLAGPELAARVVLIAGPTAAGKSEVALRLAEALGGEIVSVDSMQVYRGLDIGTAKPSPADRARVPHHLLDVVDLNQSFDVSQFVGLAQAAVGDILRRGRVPILCGGTGLYFRAFLEGLGEAPASDPALRRALEQTPLPELLEELAAKDPATYAKIDRQNPRRIFRAIEVIRLTGRPFSAQRTRWCRAEVPPAAHIGLSRGREDLARRIDSRVEAMFRAGLVEETRRLLDLGLARNQNASQALGYKQVLDHLAGRASLADTIELVKSRTRNFAKRQMTWFRGQLALNWLEIGPAETAGETAARIMAAARLR